MPNYSLFSSIMKIAIFMILSFGDLFAILTRWLCYIHLELLLYAFRITMGFLVYL